MKFKTYDNFRLRVDQRGVVTVTLDVPDRPINIFTRDVIRELSSIVGELERSEATAVVFRSCRDSGFCAGADVSAIADMGSPNEANGLLKTGQRLFHRVEHLPMPTVAVIHGPCLGGGLEFALACKYRLAIDGHSVQIGLPEIKLGVIPGWGGTLRLPRCVGVSAALPMILTGKQVGAVKALQIGLLDQVVAADGGVDAFVTDALRGKVPQSGKRRALWKRMVDQSSIGQWAVLRMARRSVASKSKHYPALPAAINAVAAGLESGHKGLETERTEFVKLLGTSTSRNLLGLFFARERARRSGAWVAENEARDLDPVQRVGVVGAGVMGAGIGQFAATRGFDVVMKEIDEDASTAGKRRVDKLNRKFAERKRFDSEREAALHARITHGWDEASLADCDLVVEAVVEKDVVKASVFSMLDRVVKPDAILSSNTSSLSVTRMADATGRPHQVAGLHFFNPVHRMELVEVVKTGLTDEATIARLIGFVKAMGKTPVVTSDSPGFLVNRVLFPYLGEAIVMVGEGISPSVIDREIRQFGMPMGPLELLDQVGLDVAIHVAQSLESVLEDVSLVVEQLRPMVQHGDLGRKTGRGFYRYHRGRQRDALVYRRSHSGATLMNSTVVPHEDAMSEIQRRLLYPMLSEAIRCHEESVVEGPWAIDLAMVLGTGFAPHRGGPLHVVDEIGAMEFLVNLRTLEAMLGGRFAPPRRLIEMAKANETFFGTTSVGPAMSLSGTV